MEKKGENGIEMDPIAAPETKGIDLRQKWGIFFLLFQ